MSFSSWVGLTCRGELLVKDQGMYPYTCYDAGLNAAAIKGFGLENSNNPSTYIEVYADKDCKDYRTTIKYSNICIDINFQGVKLIVPAPSRTENTNIVAKGQSLDQLRFAPWDSLTTEQLDAFDRELDTALIAMQTGASPVGQFQARGESRSRLGMSVLPVRNVGDLHVSATDGTITGVETMDDDERGDRAGFQFANADERMTWAMTTFQRILDYRNNTPAAQNYTGSQTVGNHDLDFDIDLLSGTFGSTDLSLLRQWLVMFARQRDNHVNQAWNLYHNGILQARLTFNAFR